MIKPKNSCAQSAELSDTVLISQVLAGDDRAFEVLMQRYHLQLYNFIGRCLKDYELAHDVLQFVFMQLYISLPKLEHNLHSKRTKTPLKSLSSCVESLHG